MTTNERDFVSAKDLPTSESESVDVLCVDNGELKRKSGANLGGEKTDLVIRVTSPLISGNWSADNTSAHIDSGSLENVVNALQEGRAPVVKAKHFAVTDSELPIIEGGVHDCSVLHYNTDISFMFMEPHVGEVRIVMNLEDADYLQVWLHPVVKTTVQII